MVRAIVWTPRLIPILLLNSSYSLRLSSERWEKQPFAGCTMDVV